MVELVFLKLGGSLLTDKTQPQTLRAPVLDRLACEISTAQQENAKLRLLIGHGSGSFGHIAASRHNTRHGVNSPVGWRGYADTAIAAARLNRLVIDALQRAGVAALPVQPSASALAHDGELVGLDLRPIVAALANGLTPVIYGDVALDDLRGGTIISTEQIFRWLAPHLAPQRVLLVGEVPGVLRANPHASASHRPAEVIAQIAPEDMSRLKDTLGSSRGVDVTGGMLTKVTVMMALVADSPSISVVHILSGLAPGLVRSALRDPNVQAGTRIGRLNVAGAATATP